MSGSKRPKGLLFCRPYLVPDFVGNVAPLKEHFDFVVLTDGRWPGVSDTREAFYRHYTSGAPPQGLTPDEVEDCIARCRLLRNIDRAEAIDRVGAMSSALNEWLDRLAPDFVVTHLIDEYVLHILTMLCRSRNIALLAYCSSYFPGYAQIFADERGRPFNCRQATLEEADAVIATITQKSFRQNYGHSSTYSLQYHLFRVVRYYLKRGYFAIKGLLERDSMQTHYALTPYIAERRSLFDYPPARIFHTDWKMKLQVGNQAVVYFPLGYFPEASTDYWINNKSIIQYETRILEIVTALTGRFRVLVKEHPHMLGIRSRSFYSKLRNIPDVVLVPPFEFSSQVMAQCQAVIIGGGSGGVEATLAGTPVFTFCETSYWFAPSQATWLDLDNIGNWIQIITDGIRDFKPLGMQDKRKFIAACLAGAPRLRPGGKIWDYVDVASFKDAIDLGLAQSAAAMGHVKGK